MSTPIIFTVTHITDQTTTSGKTKVLLNCDAVDRTITLSTLLNLAQFGEMGLRKFDRLSSTKPNFEPVETDYTDADGNLIALKKPRQTVWLNGTVEALNPEPLEETVIVDRRTASTDDAF